MGEQSTAREMLLSPGQTLPLHADGIVEVRPDGVNTVREAALRLSPSERAGLPAAQPVAELAELAESLHPDDDVALSEVTPLPASTGEVG